MANHHTKPIMKGNQAQEQEVNHDVRSALHMITKALPYIQIGSLILYKAATIILQSMGDDRDPDPDNNRFYQ